MPRELRKFEHLVEVWSGRFEPVLLQQLHFAAQSGDFGHLEISGHDSAGFWLDLGCRQDHGVGHAQRFVTGAKVGWQIGNVHIDGQNVRDQVVEEPFDLGSSWWPSRAPARTPA